MNEFEATVHSLGESTVEYLRPAGVLKVRIWADELSASAHVEICLESQEWEPQSRAIDKMIELRGIFLDDLSFDYVFVDEETCELHAKAPSTELTFA